eukprot:gene3186-6283_t
MADFVLELISFLSSDRLDLRQKALEILVERVDAESLLQHSLDISEYLHKLCYCLGDLETAVDSSKLIINILAERTDAVKLINIEPVINCILNLLQKDLKNTNIYLMLLSNVTVDERVTSVFVSHSISKLCLDSDLSYLSYMFNMFLEYNLSIESSTEEINGDFLWDTIDPWQYFSNVICNISRIDEGRKYIIQRSNNYIPKLLQQIPSKNITRRRGIIATIRNICFDSDEHLWLIYDVNIIPHILMPIVVNTPFTDKEKEGMDTVFFSQTENKKPDSDIEILKMILEIIILLCQRRNIREELRRRKIYPIVRNLDYIIEKDEISEIVFEIVDLLMRDEEPEAPSTSTSTSLV